MANFRVTDADVRRILEKEAEREGRKGSGGVFRVTEESAERVRRYGSRKASEEERRYEPTPHVGAWVDRQLQRSVGLSDNEKIDPAAQMETRRPLYEMSFPQVNAPALERKQSERMAARNAAALQPSVDLTAVSKTGNFCLLLSCLLPSLFVVYKGRYTCQWVKNRLTPE